MATTLQEDKPHVLILHGVLMNAYEMFYLSYALKKKGFEVHALSYQSVLKTPAQNATILHQKITALNLDKLHIVAHSLGGIVTLHLLEKYPNIPQGNIVMLGSPITGSWFAKRLRHWPIINKMLSNSMKRGLSGVNIPAWRTTRNVGMIAGEWRFGLATIVGGLPKQGDGTVMIKETYHERLTEHLVLNVSHTGMIFSSEVADYTALFLKTEHFRQP